jgi:hypothetical protein
MNSLIILLVSVPFINSFIISHTAYRILNATLIQDQKNLFDNKYHIYSASSAKTKIFAYDQNQACLVDITSRGIELQFESPYTQFLTSPRLLVPRNRYSISIEACFRHKSKTVLIYRNGKETNIVIGGNQKILMFDDDYQRIIHDQFTNHVYMQIDNTIYLINFDKIASLWYKHENYTRLLLDPIYKLREYLDYIIVNQSIYLIKDQAIYRDQLDSTISPIKTDENINAEKFNFLLFPAYKENMPTFDALMEEEIPSHNLYHYSFLILLKFALIVLVLFFYRKKVLDIYQKKMDKRQRRRNHSDDGMPLEFLKATPTH